MPLIENSIKYGMKFREDLIIEIKNINLYNKDKQKIDAKENFTKNVKKTLQNM